MSGQCNLGDFLIGEEHKSNVVDLFNIRFRDDEVPTSRDAECDVFLRLYFHELCCTQELCVDEIQIIQPCTMTQLHSNRGASKSLSGQRDAQKEGRSTGNKGQEETSDPMYTTTGASWRLLHWTSFACWVTFINMIL